MMMKETVLWVAYLAALSEAFVSVGYPGRGTKLGAKRSTALQATSRKASVLADVEVRDAVEAAPPQQEDGPRLVWDFGCDGKTDGDRDLKETLGGKGANLAAMAKLGLPVPPGFTLSTDVCSYYYSANGREFPPTLEAEVLASLSRVEAACGKKFGDAENPLLLSVRSGARSSMPGMMDTILNLGLNDEAVLGLAAVTNDARFAYDCYRRFVSMYSEVVLGVKAAHENDPDPFEHILEDVKKKNGVTEDVDLTAEDLRGVVERYKHLVEKETGAPFPQDPMEQLWGAVGAVFRSWGNERAKIYRHKYNIPAEWGTACNVQAMVFGNAGPDSGTGCCFTRNPAAGTNALYGEYLINAQGEDVVAGIRTPKPIAELKDEMPESYAELSRVREILETEFTDMQDLEFTVEKGRFWLLQTRDGKRTGLAAVTIAYEMVEEGVIDPRTALKRVPAESVASLLAPAFDPDSLKKATPIASGLPAGPGAAAGHVCFSAKAAETLTKQGKKAVLCRVETTPDDVRGMVASEGILTTRGGVSSHAALVARQMGKVCVCGAGDVQIDYARETLSVNGRVVFRDGDLISIDGTTGHIYAGELPTAGSEVSRVLSGDLEASESRTFRVFDTVLRWADEFRTLDVRANVDTPEQAHLAMTLGAQGIGLCRTEHMFFSGERLDAVRAMLLAAEDAERRTAARRLLPFQRDDFYRLFKALDGKFPITIRLLDPPIHEFLPHDPSAKLALAETLGVPYDAVQARVQNLEESNPMLGHRGCRLAISHPEITEIQARAIFEAAAQAVAEGTPVRVEIMVPFVGFKSEFDAQKTAIDAIAKHVMDYTQTTLDYAVGTMIELPRAALTADQIAQSAEFFSFGTNDLSQMTLGASRDDVGAFLQAYFDNDILAQNPFASIDTTGVGQLVHMAVDKGRRARPDLKLGVCGEHGGDPASIKFFHDAGLHYVSCSAPRVPIARLAAAQAAIDAQDRQDAEQQH